MTLTETRYKTIRFIIVLHLSLRFYRKIKGYKIISMMRKRDIHRVKGIERCTVFTLSDPFFTGKEILKNILNHSLKDQ